MSEQAGGDWLTVSQAAAALRVSEKTLLRRIRRGEIEAAKEPLAGGGTAWRVLLAGAKDSEQDTREGTGKDSGQDTKDSAPEPDRTKKARAGTVPEVEQDTKDSEQDKTPEVSFPRAGTGKDSAKDTGQDTRAGELLDHLRDENKFLREQIEAHARSEAELRAALREALKLSARQLPAPGESSGEGSQLQQVATGLHDAVEGPGSAQTAAGGSLGGKAKRTPGRATERTPRPLWQVVFGYRPKL
jgi:excisionase family DNA binding protein